MEDEKMVEQYLALWGKIYALTQGGESSRVVQTQSIMAEVRHDQRMAQIRKEPVEPASQPQKDLLLKLSQEIGVSVPSGLSKREAHTIIDLLLAVRKKKAGG